MSDLVRIGTTYVPVQDVETASAWYSEKLGAEINYQDQDKAILNLANQAFFLVRAQENETSNFQDSSGNTRFSLTFEVDGESALEVLHKKFQSLDIEVGEIEDRGHPGRNFIFQDLDGNLFDVWSELSPVFKEKFQMNK
ncbi:VOC family protein [Radiobacillus kanasensis]|uniref:VOC family protein n=1 Tax=Radiobacillus kanasensis TaxID=2844358 RepID=UPI001E30F4C5|nr:VOC family protein [Radiobacillus kanasensis]UFU00721.1 VOC family protein [Radiobacillus kanasensis]